jgi:hypothetical protein
MWRGYLCCGVNGLRGTPIARPATAPGFPCIISSACVV